MSNPADNDQEEKKGIEFQGFALKRVTGGLALVIAVLWALGAVLGYFEEPKEMIARMRHQQTTAGPVDQNDSGPQSAQMPTDTEHAVDHPAADMGHAAAPMATADTSTSQPAAAEEQGHPTDNAAVVQQVAADAHGQPAGQHATVETPDARAQKAEKAAPAQPAEKPAAKKADPQAQPGDSEAAPTDHGAVPAEEKRAIGVTFVEAVIQPMSYELTEHFWGWRPNDILDFTDNVNHFQLGVLEVTRRAVVNLTERISRTGSTDAFEPNLQNAMNWFMIKADRYWFPSPESKYKDGLRELEAYKDKLMNGTARFHTRTDNLIPLLTAFEDLLGSCDENLVKVAEEDGSPVSFWQTDNYVYYARGIASAMATILEAVQHDFLSTLESRHGTNLLHHAILSCQRAADIDPWFVTNGDLDGFLANHRANMAAPISHARFYLGQLIKTLST